MPLSFSNPRSLYVGLPIKELDDALMHLQTVHDKNKAASNELDILAATMPVNPEDQSQKDQIVGEIRSELSKIADSNDYEHAGKKVSLLARQFATDPKLQAFGVNYKTRQQEIETLRQMQIAGQQPVIYQDNANFKTVDENGNIKYMQSDIEPFLNHDETYSKIWSEALPDAVSSGILTTDQAQSLLDGTATTITPQIGQENVKYFDKDKVDRLAQFVANRFRNSTKEGRQLERMTKTFDTTYASLPDNQKEEYLNKVFLAKAKDAGYTRTFRLGEFKWENDVLSYQNTIAQNQQRQTKAEVEKQHAAVEVVATPGPRIINPDAGNDFNWGLSTDYGTDASRIYAKANLAKENQKLIYSIEQEISTLKNTAGLANNPQLQQQITDKELELKDLKVQRDLATAQQEELTKSVTNDYVEYLVTPVTSDGLAAESKVDPNVIDHITVGLDTEQVRAKTSPQQIGDYISKQEGTKKYVDWITYGLTKGRNFPNKDYAENQFKSDVYNVLNKVAELKILDNDQSKIDNYLNHIFSSGGDLAGNSKFVDDQTQNEIVYNLKVLSQAIDPITNSIKNINDSDNLSEYYERVQEKPYSPNVYDVSQLADGKPMEELSNIVSNQLNNFTFISQVTGELITGAPPITNVKATGLTDYIPGQGYLITVTGDIVDSSTGKSSGNKMSFYAKPRSTDGIIDSNVNKIVQRALVGNYTNTIQSPDAERALQFARAIESTKVDSQFDRFRLIPPREGQTLDTDVIVDETNQFNVVRETRKGVGTYYTVRRKDGQPFSANQPTIKFNSLEKVIEGIEAVNRTVNYVPVDNSIGARSFNFGSISFGDVSDGYAFGVPVGDPIPTLDEAGKPLQLISFKTPEDGLYALTAKLQKIQGEGTESYPNQNGDLTVNKFRNIWVYGPNGEHQKETNFAKVLQQNFYPNMTPSQIENLPINKIPIKNLVYATAKTELTAKVFKEVFEPTFMLIYGQ